MGQARSWRPSPCGVGCPRQSVSPGQESGPSRSKARCPGYTGRSGRRSKPALFSSHKRPTAILRWNGHVAHRAARGRSYPPPQKFSNRGGRSMQGRGMPMPDRLLPGPRDADRLQGQCDFDESLMVRCHLLNVSQLSNVSTNVEYCSKSRTTMSCPSNICFPFFPNVEGLAGGPTQPTPNLETGPDPQLLAHRHVAEKDPRQE
jgi:hypothetical protein